MLHLFTYLLQAVVATLDSSSRRKDAFTSFFATSHSHLRLHLSRLLCHVLSENASSASRAFAVALLGHEAKLKALVKAISNIDDTVRKGVGMERHKDA